MDFHFHSPPVPGVSSKGSYLPENCHEKCNSSVFFRKIYYNGYKLEDFIRGSFCRYRHRDQMKQEDYGYFLSGSIK